MNIGEIMKFKKYEYWRKKKLKMYDYRQKKK